MGRPLLRLISSAVVGVLLLAQLAIAAYACPGLVRGLATDFQTAAAPASQPDVQMGNCGDMSGATDSAAPNLCAEHCRYGQQSDHASTLTLPAVLLSALYALPPPPALLAPRRSAAFSSSALASVDPPHAILHCCLRT